MAARTAKDDPTPGSFYTAALNKAEQSAIELAREVEGVDEELVVLRLRLRTLAKSQDFDLSLLLRSLDSLRRLVETQHKLTKKQSLALGMQQPLIRDELIRILTEVPHDGDAGNDE